jgi:VIT1/CCC1 family predicted Fe2+/Mn2+ transporter
VDETSVSDRMEPRGSVTSGAPAVAAIRDMILGGQDGLVNVLGLVLGLAVATGNSRIIVTAALAAMFAESIAMAGVAYTSRGAERDFAAEMRGRLSAELAADSAGRIAELRADLSAAGRTDAEIEAIARVAGEESRAWEAGFHRLDRAMAPVREAHPGRAAVVVGLSTIVGSSVPLVPFLILPIEAAAIVAVVGATVVLFVAGVQRARLTGGRPMRAGLEMVAIGLLSALAGFLIGQALRSPGA